jgi:nucleoside-diphosphate-sugar epimerase
MGSMLVALTGASGFIGSFAARSLASAGHRVRALVRPSSRRDHIAPFVAEWIVGNQNDPESASQLVAGADAVIHNSLDWDRDAKTELPDLENNVMGSLRLLESARLAGTRQFIFVSSVAVYHEIPPSAGGRITEETVTWPSSTYGAYKAAVESHLKAYHVTHGMNTSAWRPAAVYGVDPNLRRSQWYDLIDRARQDDQTIAEPRGGKITHVQDVADALALAVGDPSVAGQLFNLVERYMYWQEAAEIARELSGSKARIEDHKGAGPKNQFDTRKAVDFFERHGNHTALRHGHAGMRDYVQRLLGLLPPVAHS